MICRDGELDVVRTRQEGVMMHVDSEQMKMEDADFASVY